MVGGVGHDVDRPVAVPGRQLLDQRGGDLHLRRARLGPPQPHRHRQAERPGAEWQLDDDSEHGEAATVADRLLAARGAVVLPGRAEHLSAALLE